jgi:hypothetical protein
MRRLIASLLLGVSIVVLVICGANERAQAQSRAGCAGVSQCVIASEDDEADRVDVMASSEASAPGSPAAPAAAGGSGPRTWCLALQPGGGEGFDESRFLTPEQMAARITVRPSTRVAGQMYALYCQRSDDVTGMWNLREPLGVFTPPPPAAPRGPTPTEVLATQAAAQIALPAPMPSTAPPRDIVGLVGISTWLWVDPAQWVPLAATAAAGGVEVTATATPVRTVWDMGEGHDKGPVTCRGPGKPYLFGVPDNTQRTWCSYVFQWASDDHRHDDHGEDTDDVYHARADIIWEVTWHASTGESGTLAEMMTSTAFDLTIGEIQAVVCYDTPLGHCNPTTTGG